MIKIAFADMPLSFNANDNFVLDILKKYSIEFVVNNTIPDVLFYSCYGHDHFKYSCVKIFWTVEPVCPDFNECDYAVAFDDIVFGDRYIRRPIWMFEQLPDPNVMTDAELLNRKFCNFIYSNATNGDGARLRTIFAEKLMKYKPIDCPGKVLNNMKDAISPREGDWKAGKLDFISNYKFTIAFENTKYPGYTTEKLTQPIMMRSMPIYWGNPSVANDFNTDGFTLYEGDESGLDELIDKVISIDENDDLYLSMMRSQIMSNNYNQLEKEDLEKFLINIMSNGLLYNKDPLGYRKELYVAIGAKDGIFKRFFK